MPQNIDLDELVENGRKQFAERMQRKSETDYVTCRCGALVAVPDASDVDEDDVQRGLCDACDTPTGVKAYRAIAKHR